MNENEKKVGFVPFFADGKALKPVVLNRGTAALKNSRGAAKFLSLTSTY